MHQCAYKASLTADQTASIRLLLYLSPPPFVNVTPDMIRIRQCTIASNECIACLSLHSFLDAYKDQVQKMMINQSVRDNHFCFMTQLFKTFCYCRKILTYIITSLHPMPNFQPHKKKKMAAECLSLVTPPTKHHQHSTVTPKPVNS